MPQIVCVLRIVAGKAGRDSYTYILHSKKHYKIEQVYDTKGEIGRYYKWRESLYG